MKNDLKIIKTSLGEIVAAELTAQPDGYILSNPFILNITETGANAKRFIPGTMDKTFFVPKSYVISTGSSDDFTSRLYGSTLFSILVQELLDTTDVNFNNQEEFDKFLKEHLGAEREVILKQYGMIDSKDFNTEEQETNKKRVLH